MSPDERRAVIYLLQCWSTYSEIQEQVETDPRMTEAEAEEQGCAYQRMVEAAWGVRQACRISVEETMP